MTVVRRSALALAVLVAALTPAAALAHGHGAAHHSLRAPVTDQNFYFVMADRFKNGDTANDNGGLPPGKGEGQSGFDPTGKGWYHGGDLKGLTAASSATSRASARPRSGSRRASRTRRSRTTTASRPPATTATGSPTSRRSTRTWAPTRTCATLVDARPQARHQGLLRHHLQPHRRRHPLPGGRRAGRTRRRTSTPYKHRRRHAVRRPRLRRREHVPGAGADRPAVVPAPGAAARASPTTRACRTAERDVKVPAWLNDVSLYHNRGNTTFAGENSQYGDFFGLDDLFTENPRVVNGMIDIYKTWIRDFRIDGFRMDTMKHVDDAFWQKFAPAIERYARSQGIRDFYMFGEVAEDISRPITSHYMTHDDVQGVLDFPFQTAATRFAANSAPTDELRDFFVDDDWYTDGDSNVYNLPTFLGNHDKGRIGMFIRNANPRRDARPSCSQRDRARARAHVLLARQPGRLLRRRAGLHRQRRRPGRAAGHVPVAGRRSTTTSTTPTSPATTAPARTTTSAPTRRRWTTTSTRRTRSTASSRRSRALTRRNPALRNGAQQHRFSSSGRGRVRVLAHRPLAPARVRRRAQQLRDGPRRRRSRPTCADSGWEKVYGDGPQRLRSGARQAARRHRRRRSRRSSTGQAAHPAQPPGAVDRRSTCRPRAATGSRSARTSAATRSTR